MADFDPKDFDPTNPEHIDRYVDFYATISKMKKRLEKYNEAFKSNGAGFYSGKKHNGVNVDTSTVHNLDQDAVAEEMKLPNLNSFKTKVSKRWNIKPVNDK